MTPRGRTALALAAAVVAITTAALGMLVWWDGERSAGDWQWTLPVALVYGPASVALARRAPQLATAFGCMAVSAGVSLLAGEQAGAVAAGRSQLAGGTAVWLSSWTWLPSYAVLLAVVPHLLPDGRGPSGRWRWGLRLGAVAAALATLGWVICPYDELDEASDAALALGVTNPVGVPGAGLLVGAGLVLVLLAAATGLVSLAMRWRRGEQRQRLAWVLGGVALTVVLMLASLLVPGGSAALMGLAVLPLPASVLLGAAASASRLESELREAKASIAVAHEEERRRLRHDLHDSLGPALAGVALQLEGLPAVVESDPARASEVAERLTLRVQEAVAEVRRLVEGLGRDGALGLAEELRAQVEGFDAPTMRSSLQVDPDELHDLPAAVEVVAVRVVREALANAARHARGDRCSVTVARGAQALDVRVRDNGIGLAAARAAGRTGGTGVGLLSMQAVAQQIGGTCAVDDAPGGGTEVRLLLPLPRAAGARG